MADGVRTGAGGPQANPARSAPLTAPVAAPAADPSADPFAAHAALVAALCRPGAVDPAVTGGATAPPQRIDTHLSTLLLWPARVLKLKKPLQRPFVDFSTAALRHQACLEELRLNRRTAPQHYLGVLPVRAGASGPQLSGPGAGDEAAQALDWAVWMRRFDPAQGFDQLAAAGQLTSAHIDALAAAVARFHTSLPPLGPDPGHADATRRWPRENLQELSALWPADDPAAHEARALLRLLGDWTEARGAALAAQIAQRRTGGRVRECHGDLHLGNIVWDDGAPLIFDALEFNAQLRQIDTLGDLAFTFMDLHAHGLPRLAWRWASAVLEAGDDLAALPLLGWWAAYRAAVRAKVALLSGGPGATRLAAAWPLLRLAARLAGLQPPAATPRLVMTLGLSGSGKSQVAAALAEHLGGVRVRADVERKRLFGLAPQQRGGAARGLYTREAGQRTYARLQALAETALAAGVPVVVDAASLRRAERDAMRAVAARLGLPFTLLGCRASPAVLQQRLAARAARGDDPSDAGPALLAQQASWAEWPDADEADEADGLHWLDTDGGPEIWGAALASWLASALASGLTSMRAARPVNDSTP